MVQLRTTIGCGTAFTLSSHGALIGALLFYPFRLRNVELFSGLNELVLDNNSLGDDVEFPALPNLTTLSLNKNRFGAPRRPLVLTLATASFRPTVSRLSPDTRTPQLHRLSFHPLLTALRTGCRISDTEKFLAQIKKSYPKLRFMSLLGNEACPNELVLKDESDYQRYRYYVLYHLPHLKFLDSRSVTADEVGEASRVGQFMKVRSYSNGQCMSPTAAISTALDGL